MVKLTADDILAMAAEANLESPRVILRKLNSGSVAHVVRHGPDSLRREIIIERMMGRAAAKGLIAFMAAGVQP